MDWLAKMLGLPDKFLHHHPDSVGGGVLQVGEIRGGLINILLSLKWISLWATVFLEAKPARFGLWVWIETNPNFTLLSQILVLNTEDYRIGIAIAFCPNCVMDNSYSCGLTKGKWETALVSSVCVTSPNYSLKWLFSNERRSPGNCPPASSP